MFVVHTLPIN